MDLKSLDAIRDQLQEQQARIIAKADKLRTELEGLDDDRARIDSALAALSGNMLPSASGKKKQEKRKTLPPSATKAQVITLVAEELSQRHVIEEEELRSRVEKKLVDSGHSRMGYKLRFKEALEDSQFLKTADGFEIRKDATAGQAQGSRAS